MIDLLQYKWVALDKTEWMDGMSGTACINGWHVCKCVLHTDSCKIRILTPLVTA